MVFSCFCEVSTTESDMQISIVNMFVYNDKSDVQISGAG